MRGFVLILLSIRSTWFVSWIKQTIITKKKSELLKFKAWTTNFFFTYIASSTNTPHLVPDRYCMNKNNHQRKAPSHVALSWSRKTKNTHLATKISHEKNGITQIYPEKATILLVPLVGNRKKAKSRDGSHISVNEFGRYTPIECVRVLVSCSDLRLKLDLERRIYIAVRTGEPIFLKKERYARNAAALFLFDERVITPFQTCRWRPPAIRWLWRVCWWWIPVRRFTTILRPSQFKYMDSVMHRAHSQQRRD